MEDIPSDGQYIQLRQGCEETPRDGFTHTSETDRSITLCASDIAGLKFAVFDLIECLLGVRWLFPAPYDLGTYRPAKGTLILTQFNGRLTHETLSQDGESDDQTKSQSLYA